MDVGTRADADGVDTRTMEWEVEGRTWAADTERVTVACPVCVGPVVTAPKTAWPMATGDAGISPAVGFSSPISRKQGTGEVRGDGSELAWRWHARP